MMTDKEKKLFNEICYVALMTNAIEGTDVFEYRVSPDYITEHSDARDNLTYFWRKLHPLVRVQVKHYCDRWDLPLKQWLDDLGIDESILFPKEKNS